MSRTSFLLLTNTTTHANLTGEAIRADGWWGTSAGFFTVAIYANNLQGRVYIEGSLASVPTAADWFPILLGLTPFVQFPINPLAPTGQTGDTGVTGFSFRGNFIWLRARLDRTYLFPGNLAPSEEEVMAFGHLDKVLLNS